MKHSPHGLRVPDLCAGQGDKCPACLQASRKALGIAPGCNPLESRVVRLLAILLVVIAACAVVAR